MSEQPLSLLKDVTADVQRWRVCVRIARLWEFHDSENPEKIIRYDFVMVDEKSDTMQGYIPKVFLQDFKDVLTEGHVYYIDYFQVEQAKEQFRAAPHPFQAAFTRWTKVSKVEPVPMDFPLYGCAPRSFNDIIKNIDDKVYLADIVAMITGVSNIGMAYVKGRGTAKRTLRISDTRETAYVTLWGSDAEQLDVEALRSISLKDTAIVLIVGCTYKMHESALSFSATYGSRLYINPSNNAAMSFRNSIKVGPYPIQLISEKGRRIDQADITITTITALSQMVPHDIMNKRFRCKVTLEQLSLGQNWWFLSCEKCTRTAFPDGDTFRCSICPHRIATPRYKLAFQATDGNTNLELLFFGETGQQLIGRRVDELVAESRSKNDEMSVEITSILGRCYVVDVTVSRGSFRRREISYQVLRVHPEGSVEFIEVDKATILNTGSALAQSSASTSSTTDEAVEVTPITALTIPKAQSIADSSIIRYRSSTSQTNLENTPPSSETTMVIATSTALTAADSEKDTLKRSVKGDSNPKAMKRLFEESSTQG